MWPFYRRQMVPHPSPDAEAATSQAERALTDAKNLDTKVDKVAQEAAEIKRVNHIADAVDRSIRGA
jgi:hypothetical protein